MFGGGREQVGLRARFEGGELKVDVLAVSDFALVLPSLLRDLGVGGGERPARMKFETSRSDAIVEADRRENALLLIDRSGVSSILASSLAT